MINVIFNKSDYEISQRKVEMYEKYLKVIQWGRRNPVKFMEMIFGLQFTDHQRYVLLSTWTTRYAVWLMSRNSGKATCLDTIVYTNNGEKQIGDLKIGDLIYDNNNELTEVIHLNPIIFEQVYEVEFDDGEIIKCNAEHLWCVCNSKDSLFNIVETKELYNYLNNSIGNTITIPDLNGTKNIIKIKKTNEKKAMRCITVSNDTGLFLCGENKTITHNSYLSAPYMMARSILIPNHKSYILCPSGNQAQQTFSKIEDLAKGKVASVKGSTGVFLAELMRANAGTDPFVHDKHSHHCELYNGSSIWTVNSVAKNAVGIRSNLNFYDEAGKVEREFFALTEPFCTQDTNFATGADFNIKCYPRQLPNQIIYASSAETIDSQLYDAYKDGAMRMIAGDPEYFVCDITCELSLNPYMDGKPYSPLLSREVIDDAMRKNEYKATREYYNKFDIAGGQDALVKRTTLIANSYAYAPIYQNENDIKQYVIAYDPATKLDNSMIGIGEIFTHPENGLMLKIVDMINLIEKTGNGEKKVIQKPDQVEILKKILLKYNGRVPDYDNLIRILIDAGSGGGGFDIAQYLLRDWIGVDGRKHLGLIDLQDKYLKEEKDKFPGAVDKLTMVSFTKYKTEIYTECQNMINQGLVMFPKSLNLKGEMEFEEEQPDGTIKIITERMNSDEIKSLVEIDLLKEELVAMQKTQNGSTIKFDLLPSKKLENMHKDIVHLWYNT